MMGVDQNMQRPTRRRLTCLAFMSLLIPFGMVCRFVPIGLPPLIVKYGGSFLWAMTVYWFIAFFLARQRPLALGLIALVVTTAIEFLKQVQSPQLEIIRDTFFGKVILGRYFSYTDIVVYWFAVLWAAWIDHTAIHGRAASKE
jgi:hypothetical protein